MFLGYKTFRLEVAALLIANVEKAVKVTLEKACYLYGVSSTCLVVFIV